MITKEDIFGKDIQRVELSLNKLYAGLRSDGVWTDGIRTNLFSDYITNREYCRKHDPIDINGYVDRESEDFLNIVNNRIK